MTDQGGFMRFFEEGLPNEWGTREFPFRSYRDWETEPGADRDVKDAIERGAFLALILNETWNVDPQTAVDLGVRAARAYKLVGQEADKAPLVEAITDTDVRVAIEVWERDASVSNRTGDAKTAARLRISVEEHGSRLDWAASQRALWRIGHRVRPRAVSSLSEAIAEYISNASSNSRSAMTSYGWHEQFRKSQGKNLNISVDGETFDYDQLMLYPPMTFFHLMSCFCDSVTYARFAFGMPPFPETSFSCDACGGRSMVSEAMELRGLLLEYLTQINTTELSLIQDAGSERLDDAVLVGGYGSAATWEPRLERWQLRADPLGVVTPRTIRAFQSAGADWIRPADIQQELSIPADGPGGRKAAEALSIAKALGFFAASGKRLLPGTQALCASCALAGLRGVVRAPTRTEASRSISPRLRFEVLQRDGFRCVYCGAGRSDGVSLQVDHIVPFSSGGETDLSNLQTACVDCNLGKSDRSIL